MRPNNENEIGSEHHRRRGVDRSATEAGRRRRLRLIRRRIRPARDGHTDGPTDGPGALN